MKIIKNNLSDIVIAVIGLDTQCHHFMISPTVKPVTCSNGVVQTSPLGITIPTIITQLLD
jgi:hypothetical protein